MTKKDLKAITIGATVGIGGLLALWFFARKAKKLPELLPTQVKFESNGTT